MSTVDVAIHAAPINEEACDCPPRACDCPPINSAAALEYRRRWAHQHSIVQIRDAEIARLTAELAVEQDKRSDVIRGRNEAEEHARNAEAGNSVLKAEVVRMDAEVAAIRQQICRLVSGQAIESDSLCQHHDEAIEALAEVADLRAKLTAARAVPPDIEAAILMLRNGFDVRDGEVAALHSAISNAISDAKAAAVADFIDVHAKRLVEQSGASWDNLRERQGHWRGAVHDVLDRLVASDGWITAASQLRETLQYPCRSCGIDHTTSSITKYPAIVTIKSGPHKGKIGAAIEWRRDGAPAWMRVVIGVDDHGFEIRENFDPCQLFLVAGKS